VVDETRMVRELLDGAPSPSPEATAKARMLLMEHIHAAPTRYTARLGGWFTAWSWHWPLAGIALSAAVAVAMVAPVFVATPPEPPGRPDAPAVVIGAGADASSVLRLAAANALTQEPVKIRSEQYIYRRIDSEFLSVRGDAGSGGPVARVLVTRRHEMWYLAQGISVQRMRITEGASRTPLTPADAAAATRLGWDLTAPAVIDEYGPTTPYERPAGCTSCPIAKDRGLLFQPTPEYLASLPADPARLLATFREAVGDQNSHSPDQQLFEALMQLLRDAYPMMSPDLRSTLYQVIGAIAGVVRIDGQVVLGGRSGIAIGRDREATEGGTQRTELVFDTSGHELLGFRTVQIRAADGFPVGTVTGTDRIAYAIVDDLSHTS
jgi:hypothetical protein